jgi:2',3'-cyclic-nucleotide 2'-phosphodiesterase (5'-nucleotidase family)
VAAVGLGPNDLAAGPDQVRLPRQVANLPASAGVALAPPTVVAAGSEKIGVFGVIDPALVPTLGASDPIAAATAAVAKLRADGATRVFALASMTKKDAVALVRKVGGIDLVVIAAGIAAPEPKEVRASAEVVGGTIVVVPANRGQVVSRLDLTLRPGGGPLIDAIGPAAAADRQRELTERLATLDEELARFAKDPEADQAFVAAHRRERDELARTRGRAGDQPAPRPGDRQLLRAGAAAHLQGAGLRRRRGQGQAGVHARRWRRQRRRRQGRPAPATPAGRAPRPTSAPRPAGTATPRR